MFMRKYKKYTMYVHFIAFGRYIRYVKDTCENQRLIFYLNIFKL